MKYMIFAVAYGEGNYSACGYSEQAGSSTTCPTITSSERSGLANTGIDLLVIATFACLLIFIGLLVRFWRRKPSQKLDQRAAGHAVGEPKQSKTGKK